MKYMGSKSKIAKHIVPIIQSYIYQSNSKAYWEPFCGGCNVIEHIDAKKKFASDNNRYLIELMRHLNDLEFLPRRLSKEQYVRVRDCYKGINNLYPDWYVGAIGFLGSYNGRFFDGGYAAPAGSRDYYDESRRNLMKQRDKLNDVEFVCNDYLDWYNIRHWIIYCDPPYRGVKKYRSSVDFDHDIFWDWVRERSKDNLVLVSEASAPPDFQVVWEQPVIRTIDAKNKKTAIERLFIWKGGLQDASSF